MMFVDLQVVNSTLAKYPKREIVLTGHSLGCTLAAMMSIQFRKKVVGVCFSLPGEAAPGVPTGDRALSYQLVCLFGG